MSPYATDPSPNKHLRDVQDRHVHQPSFFGVLCAQLFWMNEPQSIISIILLKGELNTELFCLSLTVDGTLLDIVSYCLFHAPALSMKYSLNLKCLCVVFFVPALQSLLK